MAENRIRSLRPHVHWLDRGDEHWRCGVVWSIAGGTATLRIACAPMRDFSVATSLLPNPSVGAPVVVRLEGNDRTGTIADVRATHWGGGGPGTDEAGAVARGVFHHAVIPRSITGASEEYPWTKT